MVMSYKDNNGDKRNNQAKNGITGNHSKMIVIITDTIMGKTALLLVITALIVILTAKVIMDTIVVLMIYSNNTHNNGNTHDEHGHSNGNNNGLSGYTNGSSNHENANHKTNGGTIIIMTKR
jgi:hypothetical protein